MQRFLNQKKPSTVNFQKNTKEEFLLEHNRLSSLGMQITMPLLFRFREEKPLLFREDNWCIDKIRRPFIFWLTSLTPEEKERMKKV